MNQEYKAFAIGLGKIGMMYDFEPQRKHPASHVFAYEMEDGIRLTGAMDCNENQRIYLKKAAPNAKFYTSIRTGLQENSDVDIVSICTPPQYHLDNIREVLAVAKPKIIFCEKPLLNSVCCGNLKL